MTIGIPETGTLIHARLDGSLSAGFRVATADGCPARLAIIDDLGHVIEAGEDLARETWDLCLRVQTNFWNGFGFRIQQASLRHARLEATDTRRYCLADAAGRPARLAVIDDQGAVIEAGDGVAREAWNVCIAVRKRAWIKEGRLVIHDAPPGNPKLHNEAALPAKSQQQDSASKAQGVVA
ncbi:MAG TPA: hypothetical protein VL178_15730 [Pseudomonas sp.]|nr:hypothetical protein [Pseudomonas sp.]